MKKRFLPLLVAALILLSSCTTVGLVEEPAVKTGFGLVPSFTSSKEATADKPGLAQINVTFAGVMLDADGKIIKCVVDASQVKINFDASGKITSDLNAPVLTKIQLGDGYNMRGASAIGKEWNEQSEAFSAYCVGKTAEEVAGIAVDEKKHPTDADLLAGVTINIAEMVDSVVAACENAQALGAQATDLLGIATDIDLAGRSKDATADANGTGFSYAHYAAVTLNAEGKITSAALNASQFQVAFTKEGKIATDLNAPQLDKQQLKENYNMKGASGIGKEWYEQANFFAEYAKGKTAAEVLAIALDDKGHAADADVRAGATITITGFQKVIEGAAAAAK